MATLNATALTYADWLARLEAPSVMERQHGLTFVG